MGRSQETSNKKEVKNKQEKKRKDKALKKQIKKGAGKSSFDDMIAYVDEFGKITSTPPDPNKKILIDVEGIELGATKNEPLQKNDFIRKGVVTFFNESKGFGFIRDLANSQSIFVHANNLEEDIKENNIVSFEIGKGPKGPTALKVALFKK